MLVAYESSLDDPMYVLFLNDWTPSWLTVEPIDDITIHMETPEIKDKLLVGQCIAIDIN